LSESVFRAQELPRRLADRAARPRTPRRDVQPRREFPRSSSTLQSQ